EVIESLRAGVIHESIAANGQAHYAIVVVLAECVEQMDELLVGVAVEEQLAAVSVQGDFEHAIWLAAEAGVRERLAISVEFGHWDLLSAKLFHRDRQVAPSLAGRVILGIRDLQLRSRQHKPTFEPLTGAQRALPMLWKRPFRWVGRADLEPP